MTPYPTLASNVLIGKIFVECMALCTTGNDDVLNVHQRIDEMNVSTVDMLTPSSFYCSGSSIKRIVPRSLPVSVSSTNGAGENNVFR